MMRSVLLASCLAFIAGATPSLAQNACPGGARAASGQCVDPMLVADTQATALILAQPKLSQTQPPIPLELDRTNPVTRDYIENQIVDRFSTSRLASPRTP